MKCSEISICDVSAIWMFDIEIHKSHSFKIAFASVCFEIATLNVPLYITVDTMHKLFFSFKHNGSADRT